MLSPPHSKRTLRAASAVIAAQPQDLPDDNHHQHAIERQHNLRRDGRAARASSVEIRLGDADFEVMRAALRSFHWHLFSI